MEQSILEEEEELEDPMVTPEVVVAEVEFALCGTLYDDFFCFVQINNGARNRRRSS